MKSKKNQQIDKVDDRINWSLMLITLLMLILIFYQGIKEDRLNKQISSFTNLSSTYHTSEGSAYVRFNLSDDRQVLLLQQLEKICLLNDIHQCMNPLDILKVSRQEAWFTPK